jgi:hypothetical protein
MIIRCTARARWAPLSRLESRKAVRRALSVILALSLGATGCISTKTVQLPVSGRVYFEDVHEETEAFSPLPNALVIVRRNVSCPRNIWLLMEGAVNSIDSYVVRADSEGYFSVPPREVEIIRSCNAVMSASAAVPFMRSHLYILNRPVFGMTPRH